MPTPHVQSLKLVIAAEAAIIDKDSPVHRLTDAGGSGLSSGKVVDGNMFDFLKRAKAAPSLADAVADQVMGSQAMLYGFFLDGLGCREKDIQKMEIAYFATAVMTFALRRFADRSNLENLLDSFTTSVLRKSLASGGEKAKFGRIVSEFRGRLIEYEALMPSLFNPDMASEMDPATKLWHQVFGSVTTVSAPLTNAMQDIAGTRLMLQFGAEQISFVKKTFAQQGSA